MAATQRMDKACIYFSKYRGRFKSLESTNWLFNAKEIIPIPLPRIQKEFAGVITALEWMSDKQPWTSKTKVIKFVLARDRMNQREIINIALNTEYEPAILRTHGEGYERFPYTNIESDARAWGQQRYLFLQLRNFMKEYQEDANLFAHR